MKRVQLHLMAAAVAAAAIVLSACTGSGGDGAATAPSAALVVSASIRASTTTPAAPAFVDQLCLTPAVQPAPTFFIGPRIVDLFVTTSQPIDLSLLTLQLIDGSHLGGPSITFPQPTLNTMFGSTRVPTGSRTFGVQTRFDCAAQAPRAIDGLLTFVDSTGASHTVSLSAPLN